MTSPYEWTILEWDEKHKQTKMIISHAYMSVKHVNMIMVLVYIIYFYVGGEVYWELVQIELEVGREA